MNSPTVPVPPARHSLHAVVTAEPLEVEGSTTLPLPEPGLLRRFGATDDDIDALAARSHVTVLHHSGATEDARRDAVAARLEALSLAANHDGLVIDLAVPRLVTHAIDATDPATASQWVAMDLDGDDAVSQGLATFGLPELRVVGAVETDSLAAVLAVLTGLVHRLITEWPQADPIGPATVTVADISRGLGQPESNDVRGVDLVLALVDDELDVTLLGDPAALFA